MHKVIKNGILPNGVEIQLEDWPDRNPSLRIAAYPHAVRDGGGFLPHKGELFRLELIYSAHAGDSSQTVIEDYEALVSGKKNLEDEDLVNDRFSYPERYRWLLGMPAIGYPHVDGRPNPTDEDRARSLMTIEAQDRILEEFWAKLEDVPMDPDKETLEDDFLIFPHGTSREDVWHWFDERYSKGIAHLLYGRDGVNRTDDIAKMVYLKQFCFECETHACTYNHDGECRYALIHEKKPEITDEDGCKSGEIPF